MPTDTARTRAEAFLHTLANSEGAASHVPTWEDIRTAYLDSAATQLTADIKVVESLQLSGDPSIWAGAQTAVEALRRPQDG